MFCFNVTSVFLVKYPTFYFNRRDASDKMHVIGFNLATVTEPGAREPGAFNLVDSCLCMALSAISSFH